MPTAKSFPAINPATGKKIGSSPDHDLDDVAAAVDRASGALPTWSALPAIQRGRILRSAGQLLLERADDIAALITAEQGKPLGEARFEVMLTAESMFWFAEEARRAYGQTIPDPMGNRRLLTITQPVGVVLAITPWNIPLLALPRKVAAALAAGCTVILKPAEQTALVAAAFVAVLVDSGVPEGAINLVTMRDPGAGVGAMIDDPRVRKVSFTGSTEVGKVLLARAANTVTATTLELGGNAPAIIFDDADLDLAINDMVGLKTQIAGQNCLAPNRFLVQHAIYGEFLDRLVEKVEAIVVGDGARPGVQMGPLIDERAASKVERHIGDAVDRGSRVLTGGARVPELTHGFFFPPTVLADVPLDAMTMRHEAFGPVYAVASFANDDDAVAASNDTESGLAAYVYTSNLSRAIRIGERLEFGMVAINENRIASTEVPFGGVKQSGLGRESGHDGIQAYLETKTIAVRA
jgi:succinate-semialdehyde dehydrogenase/glutarate-semialdehyde dehydrogenase